MGEIIALPTNQVVSIDWNVRPYKRILKPVKTLKKENTYVFIFSYDQEDVYNLIMSIPGIKVVFQSKPAVNTVHPPNPRNFVCVVEFEDDVVANNLPPMPKV